MGKREIAQRHPILFGIFCKINHLPCLNKNLNIKRCILVRTKIKDNGNGNIINVGDFSNLKNGFLGLYGDNNQIIIGENVNLRGLSICIENNNNTVVIGDNTTCEGNVEIACLEGTKVSIGADCMLSANISIRTGDSHSILDLQGKRVNLSKNIKIGDHVWIGNTVKILKGCNICSNSVVGTGSIVANKFDEVGVVIVGNPARVIKREINWDRKRL